MNDIEQAMSQLSQIKTQLAATTRFRGYPPEAVGLVGVVALLITIAQTIWPERLAADDRQIVLVWGGLLLIAGLTIAVEAIGRSLRRHAGMAEAMLQGAGRAALPITVVGFVIAAIVLEYAPAVSWMLPGIWQMLIGITVFASYWTMPRAIIWAGIWYLVVGATTLLIAAQHGALVPALVGLPLVVGHFAIALVLRERGADGQGH